MPAVVNQKNVAKKAILKPNKSYKNKKLKFIHLNQKSTISLSLNVLISVKNEH